ncbi:MAG TPA: glycosyltransferase family 2 protein [Pyrinomonadaceae bacterium]
MSPRVSVVMPAYNAGRYIAESVESVRGQTFQDWELVVVDDGSEDDTRAVVEAYAASDARVRYVRRPNGGQAAARNTGLARARGSLVAFLDADDLWLPEKLEAQLAVLERTGVDLVYSDGYFFSDEEVELDERFDILPGEARGAEMFRTLFASNRIGTLSVLVKRGALDAVGLFDEDRAYQNCEDYDLWLRLAKWGAGFYGMTERLMRYRRHAAATTYAASRLLAPMLAVILKHAPDPALDPLLVRRRVRALYRDLISALVTEGRVEEARRRMREFYAWDRGAPVTALQRLLLRLSPGRYNYISREVLYRAEWHLRGLLGRPRGA